MAEVKPPRPRNVLVAEFPGLSKDDASQALRDAGGDLNKARKLVKKRRGGAVSDSDDDVVIGDTIASDAALARQLQAELNGEGRVGRDRVSNNNVVVGIGHVCASFLFNEFPCLAEVAAGVP